MHLLATLHSLNFVTANATGDILLVGGGVFLGNFAWGFLKALGAMLSRSKEEAQLERTITIAVTRAISRLETSEAAADLQQPDP